MNQHWMEVAAPDDADKYKRSLCRFMAWKEGRSYSFTEKGRVKVEDPYPFEHEFTSDELASIMPLHICKWMCLIVYNNPDPQKNDFPTKGSRNTLLYHKKALSYFMPNQLQQWDERANENQHYWNATKSKDVNKLIGLVKKMET